MAGASQSIQSQPSEATQSTQSNSTINNNMNVRNVNPAVFSPIDTGNESTLNTFNSTLVNTPLEDMTWKEFGNLLNVNCSSNIPTVVINKIRTIFSSVIQKIIEAVQVGETQQYVNTWLKRLEIIPIVLFTIRAPAVTRLSELKRRIQLMSDGNWNQLTYDLVFKMKSRQIASVDKSMKATSLLESGLVSKAFQNCEHKTILVW